MSAKFLTIIITALLLLMIASSSIFVVSEGQSALVLRLGELQTNSDGQVKVYAPGLHFKLPIIANAIKFDMRLQSLNVDQSRILTEEQKYVLVDYFAKWRIENLPLFFTRTEGKLQNADALLKQKINDTLRAAFGKRQIKEVISGERVDIMQLLRQSADQSAKSLGVKVIDVRIQAIELPKQVRDSVYERMRSEREQVATKHRSQGRATAETLQAQADAAVAVTLAKAKMNAEEIRAQGDNQAATIYAKAYGRNPQFYSFYRSLEAYQQVFRNQDSIMVLKPDGEFFKYFSKGQSNSKP